MSSLHVFFFFCSRLYFIMRTLNIHCPRSNGLDWFKYSHMCEHLSIICYQASTYPLTPKLNSRLLQTKDQTNYHIQSGMYNSPKNNDGLNNDAPVAWDGTGLTSAQFGPDGSRDRSHTILASWDMNVTAKVTNPAYRAYNSSSAYRRTKVVS